MIDETGAQEVLLAIPSATRARRREILESLEPFPLHVRSMPGFMDLASGRVKVDDLQEVDIADLLARQRRTAQGAAGTVHPRSGGDGDRGGRLYRFGTLSADHELFA